MDTIIIDDGWHRCSHPQPPPLPGPSHTAAGRWLGRPPGPVGWGGSCPPSRWRPAPCRRGATPCHSARRRVGVHLLLEADSGLKLLFDAVDVPLSKKNDTVTGALANRRDGPVSGNGSRVRLWQEIIGAGAKTNQLIRDYFFTARAIGVAFNFAVPVCHSTFRNTRMGYEKEKGGILGGSSGL